MRFHDPRLWAVILAAGEGRRLAPLTRALYGEELPKQFAVLAGDRSLLQATVERALELVPAERIVVVVSRDREWLARRQLAEWRGIDVVIQPRNLDTGPGVLLPLARVRARDPGARVVLLPADHHIAVPAVLSGTIALAAAATRRTRRCLHLLGVEPEAAETEFGWIIPGKGRGTHGVRPVDRFVEKPPLALAKRLFAKGGLWNTLVTVGSVETLWKLGRRHLPQHAACLEGWAGLPRGPVAQSRLEALYASLPPANFSREILERTDDLGVLAMRGSGWSDWGSPRRVFAALEGTVEHGRLLARIRERAPARSAAGAGAHAIGSGTANDPDRMKRMKQVTR